VPAVQLFWTWPPTQLVLPVAVHAPTPQLTVCDAKSSSFCPSQSSSLALQLASFAAGVPGVQLVTTPPLVHVAEPER
jgi:hypothetical protein